MVCSLFCARIERKNLKISLIIRKEALCPQSKAYTDKEVSHGMGGKIKPKHELYRGTPGRRN
jgi:hypothetical protein